MSLLNGEGARAEFTGITFAGKGQNLDTGAKIVHNAPNTSSYMNTRSISKDGGISTFRSAVVVNPKAKGSKSAVSCQSLMLDDISRSDTIPAMDIRTNDADVGHEAKIGRISDEAVFYLMSRGISEEEARALIVSGFAGQCFQGASAGVCSGDEQSDPAGDEGEHRVRRDEAHSSCQRKR